MLARESETNMCAPGCLRPCTHVGLCITTDGVAPPSIKRIHKLAKAWNPQHKAAMGWGARIELFPEEEDEGVN